MSIENAKKFLQQLSTDKELQKKMSGFTLDELKSAAQDRKKSGKLSDSDLDADTDTSQHSSIHPHRHPHPDADSDSALRGSSRCRRSRRR